MEYSTFQISLIKSKVIAKITREIDFAASHNEIESVIAKYGITIDEERLPINTRTYKILIIGNLSGNINDYINAAKSLGIKPGNLEFVGYEEFKRFNAEKLKNSLEYSDLIFGPTPHKTKGMGDTSSFLALAEKNTGQFPKVIRSEANSIDRHLKFSISSFKNCLEKTYYYETLNEE